MLYHQDYLNPEDVIVMNKDKKPWKVEEWREIKLSYIAKEIKSGGTPSRKNKEYWKNGTIPSVKIQDIPDGGQKYFG